MSSATERVAETLTTHSKVVIVVLLLATTVIGAGAPLVEEDASLDQFEGDSDAAEAAEFIQENFVAEGAENETIIQLIRYEEDGTDVLTREELRATLELQQEIIEHPTIGPTLVEDDPTTGVANVLALFHLGGMLADSGDTDVDPAELSEEELAALATLFGFEEHEHETVIALFDALAAFEQAGDDALDPAELDGEEREALAVLLGFDGENQETVIEILAALGAEEPFGADEIAALSEEERLTMASLLGFEDDEQATVAAVFDALVAFESGEAEIAPAELDESEREALAILLGFDGSERETVIEILAALGEDDPFGADELAQLSEDEALTLAGLLEFDGEEQETVAAFLIAVGEEFEDDDDQEFDPEELTEQEIRFLANSLGFDETAEEETILELFDRLADEPFGADELTEITPEEATALATLFGFSDEQATFVALFEALAAFEQADEALDPTELDGEERDALATLLGFDGDEHATAVELFEILGADDPLGVEDFDSLSAEEAAVLATLFGVEGEGETVHELFVALSAFEEAGEDALDPAELDETEREALATLLGFAGEERETVIEMLAVLGADEPPIQLGAVETLDAEGQAFVAELLGFESSPPPACYGEFEELAASGETAEQPEFSLECYVWVFDQMDETEFETAVQSVLGPDGEMDALALVPQSYEPGSMTAEAHNIFITQQTEGGSVEDLGGFSDAVVNAQLELRELAESQDRNYLVFGLGILSEEIDQSLEDSTAIVGPIALLFVILVLTLAYRDIVDILLGIFGILLVLLWTFGFMGWMGISFNQLMISVPVLLIGLSIDYAIHVFMRHRERRVGDVSIRRAMAVALGGVGVALIWVTATAAIGFLSNFVSPIGPLRDFGLTSAFGIFAALLIFGALIPAIKIELDGFLESRGYNRRKRAFGTGGSRLSKLLETGVVAARRAPLAVLVVALVLSGVGAYGATQVDTSFQEEDFLAEDPPAWTQSLPEPFAPGEYRVTQDLGFLQDNFQQVGREGELLIRGDVTDDEVLQWIDSTSQNATEQDHIFILPNGQPDIDSPLSVMRDTARLAPESEFNQTFAAYGGNGVPTENIAELYDGMSAINPAASEVVYRNDGEYEALRMQIGIDGAATQEDAAADIEQIGAHLEAESDGALTVVATGDPILNTEVEQDLFQTVIESLLITLIAVFAFLAVAYRLTGNPASLGIVTLLPVLFSVTWILGTMWLIEMPFNALTGTIAALTIGLGIAYSIHISARYELELRRQEDVWKAMQTTVTGTGGALLGSAATTVGGFGTLALAILPALQQFGIITGLTIIYAFLASVLVLPSLLVLWTRYLGPSEYFPTKKADESESPPSEPVTAPDD